MRSVRRDVWIDLAVQIPYDWPAPLNGILGVMGDMFMLRRDLLELVRRGR